jgi:serine/threonine protein kinase
MTTAGRDFNADLLRRLPLPLAQLYRRAHSAKTPRDRHLEALYLWDAALRLFGSVVLIHYANLPRQDRQVQERLGVLARPVAGLWWWTVRTLVPLLAEQGDPSFVHARELLFGSAPANLSVAALQAALRESDRGRDEGPSARLDHLFTELIAYRNQELGHGVHWRRPPETYARVGDLLLRAATEVFDRLDVLVGRRLVYLTNPHVAASGVPVLDRFELTGEVPARRERVPVDPDATGPPPHPDRLYLMAPPDAPGLPGPLGDRELLPLDPLLHYDPESGEVFFFSRGNGSRPPEYHCYTTGRFTHRRGIRVEALPQLGEMLDIQPQRDEPESAEGTDSDYPESRPPSRHDTDEAATAEPLTGEPASEEPLTSESPSAEAGRRRFGEFEVVEELGRGGLGTVVRGWQPVLERPVAIKYLPPHDPEKPETREHFLREIRILGRVRHANLVQIYGSGVADGCLFYAMEFIEGMPLDVIVQRLHEGGRGPARQDLRAWYQAVSEACGKLPPTNLDAMAGRPVFGRLAQLVRQVAGAAHALHEAGVVHRDIKPSNLLITADGTRAVLIDLGLAKVGIEEGALTVESCFIGTPRYASPEQVQGDQARLDCRSDVFSMGVVLWELLTGRPLFGGPTQKLALAQVLHAEPEPPRRHNPRVPPDLEAICLRCLPKDREQRYASAQELEADLDRFLDGKPVRARPRPLLRRLAGLLRTPPRQFDLPPAVAVMPHPRPPDRRPPEPPPPPVARPNQGDEQPGAPRPARGRPPGRVASLVGAPDQAFSSQTVVTLYPVPIAIAYRRFCQESHPRSRLESLFSVLEATVRYLVTLGISDLFRALVESGRDPAEALRPADFEFLRRPRPMGLGRWIGALRETARALAAEPSDHRVVQELPALCRPGGSLDADLLGRLVEQRNACVHPDGGIRLPDEKCREVLRDYRPRLDEVLREVRCVCRYPLGFVTPFAGMAPSPGEHYYHLHSCMGAWVGNTSRALDLKTVAELRAEVPFVAAPDGRRLLYLWPLLLQRRSEYTGRRTLFAFEEIPDPRRPFLTRVRAAAIDVPEPWEADLHVEPAAGHHWLLARLRDLPPAPAVPAELGLAEKLLPGRAGRLVGQEIGSNRLLSVVAVGGFGTIYAAEALDGERVAVKVIESRPSAIQMARFSQEIAKLRQAADHPGIIRLFEHGDVDVDGRICPWYSMEFALGGDLRARMNRRKAAARKRPPWDDSAERAEVCAEFAALVEAVAHLHRLRIVHRDVKPGNVLIMGDGSLRLSDFGLVRNLQPTEETLRHGPHSSTGAGAGTPGYMAPEQARGQDAREPADVYALGILLAELALGERPEAEVPPADRAGRAGSGSTLTNCHLVHQLPATLRALIERCTDADPERRPEDATALLLAFAEVTRVH